MQSAPAQQPAAKPRFSGYQVFVIFLIAFIQFTVVMDFMVLAPLGSKLIPLLKIDPQKFSLAVAAYPLMAFVGSLTASFFADRFDRKRFLLFFYTGFVLGTLLCGLAPDYLTLVGARAFTGLFGGVISSIGSAIITDLFAPQQRGRVMGFVQMAFGVSQVVGIPTGLYLASKFDWHMPFLLIVGLALPVGATILLALKPLRGHLQLQGSGGHWAKVKSTFGTPLYLVTYLTTALLPLGGYMLMPFSGAFMEFNVGIPMDKQPMVFLLVGVCTMGVGPLAGFLSDKLGRYQVFVVGTVLSLVMVVFYTNLGLSPFHLVVIGNVLLFVGITARIIPAMAINSMVPDAADRGSFMSVNSSLTYASGFIGTLISGVIVDQAHEKAPLEHFNWVGYVVCVVMVVTLLTMWFVNKGVKAKLGKQQGPPVVKP